ncbi:MAG: glycosyltransferase family 4 protein [Planctomycetaceae bacterium]|nr:glycosyltransferase family 4 protein [Planctomycetaceae bacterium]
MTTVRRIVFATTVFDEVANGPAMYAQYLWQAFRDDPDLEFHLVAPAAAQTHPRLHTLDGADTRGSLYHRIGRLAMRVAAGYERSTIIHGNIAHAMFQFVNYPGPWAVQVNDYEVADVAAHLAGTLVRKGPRRLMSLLWRRVQEQKVIPAATRVVCNSNYTRRRVLEAYRPEESRVCTIYKAVDTSCFIRPGVLPPDPLPQRPAGGRLVLVGTNWQIKGLDILLRSMQQLLARRGDLSLTVAGSPQGRANARMVALCAQLGLQDRVHFVGRLDREALKVLLWYSDLYVLPSRSEGFGVSVLEAMSAGVPVVVSRVGGLPEIVADQQWGVLVEPEDPRALAGAVEQLLGSAPRRQALSAAGAQRATAFGLHRMIDQVRALYEQLMR